MAGYSNTTASIQRKVEMVGILLYGLKRSLWDDAKPKYFVLLGALYAAFIAYALGLAPLMIFNVALFGGTWGYVSYHVVEGVQQLYSKIMTLLQTADETAQSAKADLNNANETLTEAKKVVSELHQKMQLVDGIAQNLNTVLETTNTKISEAVAATKEVTSKANATLDNANVRVNAVLDNTNTQVTAVSQAAQGVTGKVNAVLDNTNTQVTAVSQAAQGVTSKMNAVLEKTHSTLLATENVTQSATTVLQNADQKINVCGDMVNNANARILELQQTLVTLNKAIANTNTILEATQKAPDRIKSAINPLNWFTTTTTATTAANDDEDEDEENDNALRI